MYNYQKSYRYFAQVADDIKELAEQELLQFGAKNTRQSYRGVYFTAEKEALYRLNYQSRFINRVLAPIDAFMCRNDTVLYKTALKINWSDFFSTDQTFAVFATVTHSNIQHSKYAALRLKDAIVDSFRDKTSDRPDVDTRNPDVWINLHIQNNEAIISIDTSGGSLHRRGYRRRSVEAPMVETLAAALVELSGWDGTTQLYDPFCGSGTILCEAYIKATNTPPAYLREKFGFMMLPDYDDAIWEKVKKEADSQIKPIPSDLISGSDIALKAVKNAQYNSGLLNKDLPEQIKRRDIFRIDDLKNKTIICNPPYGIRLQKYEDLGLFYQDLGDFLKQKCNGSNAYIYFGEREHIKNMRLKTTWKKELNNGGLDGRLVKYEMY